MKTRKAIAYWITRMLDPIVFLGVLLGMFCLRSRITPQELSMVLVIVLGAMALPALGVFLYFRKKHWVGDWDVSNRSQRIRIFIVLLVVFFPGLLLLQKIENSTMTLLGWIVYGWFVGHAIVTLFWKQSGHTGIAMFVLGVLYEWFGGVVIPFFLLVPLLAWTRIALGKHTPAQTLGGIVYSIFILMLLRVNGILF